MQMTQAQFAGHVREALNNLYDPAALRAQPLAHLLMETDGLEGSSQGRATLHEQLLVAIERLKPGPQVDPSARAWRPYRVLQLRYVEGSDPTEVQHRLALSKSQYYREHEAALVSLVALLHAQSPQARDPLPSAIEKSAAAEAAPPQASGTVGAGVVAATPDRYPAAAKPPRWRAMGGFGLGLLVALSLLFVAQKALLHSAGAKADPGLKNDAGGQPSRDGAAIAPPIVTLSIYAGSGESGHVNGAAAQAQFAGPFGLGVDSAGTVYVADTGNQRIRSITTTGLVRDVAGSGTEGYLDGPAASAQFSSPNAVTVGPDGTVYVGDAGNLRVRAISPSGTVSTLAGSGVAGYVNGFGTAAQFTTTGAIIADAAGNTYVTDSPNNVIRRITPSGVVSTFAGTGIRGHLDGPAGVAQFNAPQRGGGVDGAGNVYILDTGDNRIRRIAPDGIVSTAAGTGVPGFADGPVGQAMFSSNILGVIADAFGNLYVMDAGNRRVREVSRVGAVTTLFEFTNPDQSPGNIKVDKAGNLFISDREHNRVYKLTIRRGDR
jgi:sugar lactone lactonase YvrE